MLNRRILRIKAMQSLYSYYLAKASAEEVVKNKLLDKYSLDPAVHDFADKPIFEQRKSAISLVFEGKLHDKSYQNTHELEDDILEDIRDSIEKYHSEIDSEKRSIRKKMLDAVEQLGDLYLKLLLLPGELSFLELQEKDKAEKNNKIPKDWHFNLTSNNVLDSLTTLPELTDKAMARKIEWRKEIEDVSHWYRELLKKEEFFKEYQSLEKPTEEDHQKVLLDLFKKFVFKNEVLDKYFKEQDLYWSENMATLKSLVQKTIKSYVSDLDEPFELMALSRNLSEDMDFFKDLYDETLQRDEELNTIISKRTKNWDLSRVALIDKIILKMALTEMIIFRSIPVKVTINEFIEISKNYSTPKSKQFINGILDVLSNELTSDGVIRKSGRGLIDNK